MTREQKAMKIAGFEGWKQHERNTAHWFVGEYGKTRPMFIEELESLYSSFDGLMPIVAKINLAHNYDSIAISKTILVFMGDGMPRKEYVFNCIQTLIDALQEAIIYYYEIGGE